MARIMSIDFDTHEIEFNQLQTAFNDIGPEALYMTHYDLAQATNYSALMWKSFLTDPRVRDFMDSELVLMQQSSIMKMMRDVDKTKSTGQAQLLNTLIQQTNVNKKKDGPVFIYTMIPLNAEEQHADNTNISTTDPFKIDVQG